MKSRVLVGVGGIAAIAVIGICVFLFTGFGATAYYTQIDNTKIEETSEPGVVNFDGNGGLKYSYTLPAYDSNGKSQDLTFGSSRELKEGAFIKLEVMPIRGVLNWEEVKYGELPEKVQVVYNGSIAE